MQRSAATPLAGRIPAQRVPGQRIAGRSAGAAGAIGATPAAASPSSLVKLPESARERCPACASPRLTQIAMTLTDGTPVQFTSCRHCEHRSWTNGDEVLPVESVLTKATKQK